MLLAFLSVAGQAAPSWQRIDATVDAGAEPAIVALVNDADDIALPCNLPLFHPKHVEKLLLHLRRTIRGQARAIALGDEHLVNEPRVQVDDALLRLESSLQSCSVEEGIVFDRSGHTIHE